MESDESVVEERIAACREAAETRHVALPLDLKRCALGGVPALLLDLDHVTCLYLEGNQLTALPEDFFVRLPALSWLDVRNNYLETLPCLLQGYQRSSLRHLLLEGNQLSHLPNELGEASRLQGLSLSRNPLEYPPSTVISRGTAFIIRFLYNALHNISDELPSSEDLSSQRTRGKDNGAAGKHSRNTRPSMLPVMPRNPSLTGPQLSNRHAGVGPSGMSGSSGQVVTAQQLQNLYEQQQQKHFQRGVPPDSQRGVVLPSVPGHGLQQRIEEHKQGVMNLAAAQTLANMKGDPHPYRRPNPAIARPPRSLLQQTEDLKRKQKQREEKLQKHKDKELLADWRFKRKQEQRRLQQQRQFRSGPKQAVAAEVPLKPAPYGTEADVPKPAEADRELMSSVKGLSLEEKTLHQEEREKQLHERIQRHVDKMKQRQEQHLSPRAKLEAARKDLEEAMENRQQLLGSEEPEYRLSAFIATVGTKDNPARD
eukprot:scpid72954/ scgid26876/ Leucine-rich repeat-containing protein 27